MKMKRSICFILMVLIGLLCLCDYALSDTMTDYIHAEWNAWDNAAIIDDDGTPFAVYLPDGAAFSDEEKLVYYTTKDGTSGNPEIIVHADAYQSGDYATYILEMVFYCESDNMKISQSRALGLINVTDFSQLPYFYDDDSYLEALGSNRCKYVRIASITSTVGMSVVSDMEFGLYHSFEMESVILEIVNYTEGTDSMSGDFNTDGDVDGSDLAEFAQYYADGDANADVNEDAAIDEGDINVVAQNFGQIAN